MSKRLKEDRAKFASFAAVKFDEEKNASRSNAEMFSAVEVMQTELVEQMQCLCLTVQDMGVRMDGKFAEEDLKRQEENRILKTEVCARIDEGLKCHATDTE